MLLQKIERLPRPLRLRKAAKIFEEAEKKLLPFLTGENAGQFFSVNESENLNFLSALAASFKNDALFSEAAGKALAEAAKILQDANRCSAQPPDKAADCAGADFFALKRAFNTVRHILLAETGRSPADWDFIDSSGRLDKARRRPFPGMFVFLEDIRSPYNTGAMFRAAESFGAEKIYLSPLCASPLHPRALRSAMGCVDVIPWEYRDFFDGALPDCPVFALETGGIPLGEFPFPRHGLLIAGSEELGVSPQALAAADASLGRVSIPCYGLKGSLNVAVAFGIVMQAWAYSLSNKQ